MKLEFTAPTIWLATEPVDFRKAINGLSELVANHFTHQLGSNLYVFYNRTRTKLKCIAQHRHGTLLIYKRLEKKRFTVSSSSSGLITINSKQLSWLLAGLDWEMMSVEAPEIYDDYFQFILIYP